MSSSCLNVLSLADLAAQVFCGTLGEFVDSLIKLHLNHLYSPAKTNLLNGVSLEFKNDIFLPAPVAEKLIYTLSENSSLTNLILSMFSPEKAQLKRLRIPDATFLSVSGLMILGNYNLKELDIGHLRVSLQKVIDLLNEWTVQNIEILRISDGLIRGCEWSSRILTNLEKLKNIRELDVSYTEFNFHNLDMVIDAAQHLESLNISSTHVDSIFPLRKRPQLKSLLMADLRLVTSSKWNDEILLNMHELRQLDVSFGGGSGPLDRFMSSEKPAYLFRVLNWPNKLTKLISLDISGQDSIEESELVTFLEYHPDLRFLGLMSSACRSSIFLNPNNPNYSADLKITGIGSIDQVVLALRLYEKRNSFIQRCLFTLFSLSENDKLGARPDVIELVAKQMPKFQDQLNVQVACTACLYNLTNADGSHSENIPPRVLSIVVERTLHTMEMYPTFFPIQKNALLTLCNDRILQEIKMDRFRCAKLVLNTLRIFNDQLIERLCVAIASVVASKISSQETNEIGSNCKYMHKLLQIVSRKLSNLSIDSTLGFTLSTLWNLTDESPSACSEFLNQDGLTIFVSMLQTARYWEPVLTKILGLLNNIAEVPHLKHCLMQTNILGSVGALLKSESIEISYFAAGILAHLLSVGTKRWTLSKLLRNFLLMELETTIMTWKQADKEMVAYRSFRPFLPLLTCYHTYQAQLWALWAIQHVLMAHAVRYYEMLQSEHVFEILQELSCHDETNKLVCSCAVIILDQLSQFKLKRITSFNFR